MKQTYILLLILVLGINMAFAQMKEKTVEQLFESPHPYANNISRGETGYTWTIAPERAQEIRVYFEYIDLEDGYDHLELSSDHSKKGQRLTGTHEKVWSKWLPGGQLTIELTSDESNNGKGFLVSRYQYRFLPQPSPEKVVEGKLWAVLVGISDYDAKEFNALPAAKNDAKRLYEFLIDPLGGGLAANQIRYLPNATEREITNAYSWLRRNVSPQDRVLFFYAGHGEVDNKEKAYLVPKDGWASYLDTSGLAYRVGGIELESWKKDLWALPAEQVAMVLDCCYSGTVVAKEGSQLRAGVRRKRKDIDLGLVEIEDQASPKPQDKSKQRIVITSCQAKEQAIELESHGQMGAFTHYLLRGISGVADSNGDNRIDIKEAFGYLQKEVQDLARKRDHTQTPQISIAGDETKPYYLKLDSKDKPLTIIITKPAKLQENDYAKVASQELSLVGKVRFGPGVREIYVDDQKAAWKKKGQEVVFRAKVTLYPGKMKTFFIKVIDIYGQEHKHDLAVESTYQPNLESTDKPVTDKPVTDKPVTDKPIADTGKPTYEKPSHKKPTYQKSTTQQKPTYEKPSHKKPRSTPATLSNSVRYYNQEKSFSIAFPKDWEQHEGAMGTTIMALSRQEGPHDQFRENVNVIVEHIGNASFQQYVQANETNMPRFISDFTKHEQQIVHLNGHRAMRFVYSGTMGQHRMNNIAYLLVHNGYGYVITCSAKPETLSQYRNQFIAIANTFQITTQEPQSTQDFQSKKPHVPASDFHHYRNPTYGFSMRFPSDWEYQEGVRGTAVMALSRMESSYDSFRENINVIVEYTGNYNLQQYVQANWNNLQMYVSHFTVHEQQIVYINGHQAMFMVYSGTVGQHTMKNMLYILVHNSRGYVITCSAKPNTLSQYREQFGAIVDSFELD